MPKKYCRTELQARKVLADTGLTVFMWDSECDEFAALAPKGSTVTPQNIRGALKRTLRDKGYAIEILEDELTLPADTKPTGVTFRFHKLDASELPPPKLKPTVKPPVIPPVAPQYAPVDRRKQLTLELW